MAVTALAGMVGAPVAPVSAQTAAIVQVDPGLDCGQTSADWSSDARWVVYLGTDCIPGTGGPDAYLRDMDNGTLSLVSILPAGAAASNVTSVAVDDAGEHVAFIGFDGTTSRAYLRDLVNSTTSVVSVDANGQLPQQSVSGRTRISSDGRWVAFESAAQLTPDAPAGASDIFVRDTVLGFTERVGSDLPPGAAGPTLFDLSADGRHVVFSSSDQLDPADTNGAADLYVDDLDYAKIEFVGVSGTGSSFPNGSSAAGVGPHIVSSDGNRVLFEAVDPVSTAPLWIVRDRSAGTDITVGVDAHGANTYSLYGTLDASGRYAATYTNGFGPDYAGWFMTDGTNITQCDAKNQVLLDDTVLGTVTLVSKNTSGGAASGGSEGPSDCNGMSAPLGVTPGGEFVLMLSNRLDMVSPSLSAGPVRLFRADMAFVPAPVNTAPPSIVGTVAVGENVVCDPGTWTPASSVDLSYQWLVDASPVAGATATSYVIAVADNGKGLSCQVTATDVSGSAVATSAVSAVPVVTAPVNTTLPRITGTVTIGNTLTCQPGTWSAQPAPSYFYDWTSNGVDISGATSSTYLLSSADAGNAIRCRVTAVNVAGSASATSNPVSLPAPPRNTKLPSITSNQTPARPGSILTCSTGNWQGAPTSYAFQWRRGSTVVIDFPNTAATYTVSSSDLGTSIGCSVRATNGGGSTVVAASNTISVPAVPTNVSPPTISYKNPLRAGTRLDCSPGTWTPTSPALTFSYQWTRDNVAIGGATNTRYYVVSADVGHQLRCQVRASNTSGMSAPADSAPVTP